MKGRTLKDAGRRPDPRWQRSLGRLQVPARRGKVTGGLTNEVARSGTQSLFIDFNHVTESYQSATLISNFIPMASGTDYEVGIWGRTDAKDLIDSEGRSAYLKLEVDFFAEDANASVGDPFYQSSAARQQGPPPLHPGRWYRFVTTLATPPGAVFAQIIWRWETGGDSGDKATRHRRGQRHHLLRRRRDDRPPCPGPNLTPAPVQEDDSSPPPPLGPAIGPGRRE